MEKRLTVREIARIAGVSATAVSFALNGKEGISEQTRKRILAVLASENYTKPSVRQGEMRTNNIAILTRRDINSIDQLFYTELHSSVTQACEGLPYNLVMTSAFQSGSDIVLPEIISSRQVDGILCYGDIDLRIIDAILPLNIPMVDLDSSRKHENQLAVYVDYDAAAYTATRYLLELGHTDIAYFGNEDLHDFNALTFNGFSRAANEANLTLGMNRVQIYVHDEVSLYACIDSALRGAAMPTAMFFATDFYAIQAIRYLHTRGIRVPEDVSVIGIDDVMVSKYTIPSLTTVNIDRESIGQYGLELLLKRINGAPCESVTLPSCNLLVRESTGPVRRTK